MDIGKIKEALEESGVKTAVVTAVEALDQSGEVKRLEGELKAKTGEAAGILDDKKKFKDRAEKAEKELEKIEHDKLPDDEKRQKVLDAMQKRLDEADASRTEQETKFLAKERENKLLELTGSIKWAKDTPQ